MKRFVQTITTTALALFVAAAMANAASLTFSTSGPGTGFNGTRSLVLNGTSGAAATLTFIPEGAFTAGLPSNVNFGIFSVVCRTCSNFDDPISITSAFPDFTFKEMINQTLPTIGSPVLWPL